jgi:hypothetical protein
MAESSDKMEVDVSSAAAAAAPTVPETLLKKGKRDEQWASTRKQQLELSRSKNVKNRQLISSARSIISKNTGLRYVRI